MNNLVQARRRSFRYDSGIEGPIVRLEISYQLGGMNYFSYKTEPRGIYASLSPMTIEQRPGGVRMEGFGIFSGTKIFVKQLQSFSEKRLTEVAEVFDSKVHEILEAYMKDKQLGVQKLKEVAATMAEIGAK